MRKKRIKGTLRIYHFYNVFSRTGELLRTFKSVKAAERYAGKGSSDEPRRIETISILG